ncbi:hypothetical protein ACFODL_04180 [Phenylobacterium terrae]|uniref:HTH iclR-type domain-containing protein n=1 Tax=Phenylobacterium terrae TaxID=2665495 RepID=A0ABW4MVL9_9CAUL
MARAVVRVASGMEDEAPLADELVTPLLQLLQLLRDAGGGDLEIHIVLLAIAERTIAHPDFRALSEAERLAADAGPFPTRGVNVRSIADSTGMPRETVRRKVAKLLRAGWVARTPEGLSFTGKAYRVLTPARLQVEQLALKFHDLVAQRRTRGA